MKKNLSLFFIVLFTLLQFVDAQNILEKPQKQKIYTTSDSKAERIEVFRDRLMVDVYHSFWMGMPSQMNSMKFHPGFNVSALWDFRMSKNSPISFGLGVGMSYHTMFSDALLHYDSVEDVMRYQILPTNIDYSLNRTTFINCHIPLEFRYRHNNGFKITLGVRLGLVAEISHRYKGDNILDIGGIQNFKNFEVYNKQKYNFDVFFRCGWKFVSVYYSYQVNQLFDEGKGPRMHPMSLGISLSIF